GQLLWQMYCYARERSYSHVIISGINDKAAMYERLGFRRLGPAVVSGSASFVPMALPLHSPPESFARQTRSYSMRLTKRHAPERIVSLMPGPVEIAAPVREAFVRRPISHRAPVFH